uniref:Uncharacterized protein n=1 Tax=Nelumbo nucifera TaxID=4432 RepID=A0A822YPR9_NELNU|nr:TPA_asm: hypothetical protein HUJ06_011677 [Nelumbo nucifera]
MYLVRNPVQMKRLISLCDHLIEQVETPLPKCRIGGGFSSFSFYILLAVFCSPQILAFSEAEEESFRFLSFKIRQWRIHGFFAEDWTDGIR